MATKIISFDQQRIDNVKNLEEEEKATLLNQLISDLPREKRLPYKQILSIVFEFRSISSKSSDLKRELIIAGYKFYPIPYNSKLVLGIKTKIKLLQGGVFIKDASFFIFFVQQWMNNGLLFSKNQWRNTSLSLKKLTKRRLIRKIELQSNFLYRQPGMCQ